MTAAIAQVKAAPVRALLDAEGFFSLGAQYAESADELLALWQQARGAPTRT